jgi:hypothetical protein
MLGHWRWALGAPLLLINLVALIEASYFPCPRCGQSFALEGRTALGLSALLADRCLHCGIVHGAPEQLEPEQGPYRAGPPAG